MNKLSNRLAPRTITKSMALRFAALAAAGLSGATFAGQTDISTVPLTNTSPAQVKPNIMLLMDTSGSMGRTHMPDELETRTGINSIGYKAAECNVLYYNRNQTYAVPKDANGNPLPVPNFTSAPYAGFGFKASPPVLQTVDLSTSFKAYETATLNSSGDDLPQPAYYYYYTGAQTLSYAAAPCTDVADMQASKGATGGGTWTRVIVGANTGIGAHVDERTNFAIWYSYYRTRMSMTKSAASLAFTPLTSSYRLGFVTINPKDNPTDASINAAKYYVPVDDFQAAQRTKWFDMLFSQTPDKSSPAREGLARVGRYYAGKTDGINSGMGGNDPVQYACQQNFTILMTDGYWNAQAETPGGGPLREDGVTLVGQQDGTLTPPNGNTPRPIWDGSATSVQTDKDALNTFATAACNGPVMMVSTSQRLSSTYQIQKTTAQTKKTTEQYTTETQQWLRTTKQYQESYAQLKQNADIYTTQTYNITAKVTKYEESTSLTTETALQYSSSKSEVQRSTYKLTESAVVYKLGVTQQMQHQYQYWFYDGVREKTYPVAACTAAMQSNCNPVDITAGWVPADGSCVQSSGSAPLYIHTDCRTDIKSLPAVVAACAPLGPTVGPAPAYLTNVCTQTLTAQHDVVACTFGLGTTNNGNGTTVCQKEYITQNVPVPAANCVQGPPVGGIYTECKTVVVQAAQPSEACTVGTTELSSSPFTATTCSKTIDYVNKPVASSPLCANSPVSVIASVGANPFNNQTARSCTKVVSPYAQINHACANGTTVVNAGTQVATTCKVTAGAFQPYAGATCTTGFDTSPPFLDYINCSPSPLSAPVQVANCTPGESISNVSPFTRTVCTLKAAGTPCPPNSPANVCSAVVLPSQVVASCNPGSTNSGPPNFITTTCSVTTLDNNLPVQNCVGGPDPNTLIETTCTSVSSAATGVQSCNVGTTAGTAPNWVNTICKHTNPSVFLAPNVPCNSQVADQGNGHLAVTCNTITTPAEWADKATCNQPVSNSGAPNYITTYCTPQPATAPVPVQNCVNSNGSAPDYIVTTCSNGPGTGPTPAAVCPPETGTYDANFVLTTCVPGTAAGVKQVFSTLFTTTVTNMSGNFAIGAPTVTTSLAGPTDVDGICYVNGIAVPPALPAAHRPVAPEAPLPPNGCAAWPCSKSVASAGGSSNSLADVAQYYYVTDLRPAMPDIVPSVGSGPEDDRVQWQHMTTFTIGLGVSGTLNYRADYRNASALTGDFADIRTGTKSWPIWPVQGLNYGANNSLWEDPRSIDDFWHTAVNGRGQYFSAGSPTSVISGLSGALAGISARLGAGAGAGLSTHEPVGGGDNSAFVTSFTSSDWAGELSKLDIDPATGAFSAPVWSAAAKLDALAGNACDNRNIKLMRGNLLVDFTWNTQKCDAAQLPTGPLMTSLLPAEQAYFSGVTVTSNLSQWGAMTDGTFGTANQHALALGSNLVNFVRGQRGLEDFTSNDATKLYRKRKHVLGDMVGSEPVYVRAPFASYQEHGYPAWKAGLIGRKPMVYVGSNDGMLHAFYGGAGPADPEAGQEAWAIIPSAVLPNLFKLADANYKNTHQFYVDGKPTVGDIFTGGNWKTILVGGLNAGGRGYYAVDVTDPTQPPVAMWEFKWDSGLCSDATGNGNSADKDCHLGYTFGRPVITKLTDDTWVVLLTSGYNNVNAPAQAGDGQGYLYVLDAATGKIRHKIATGVGDAGTPSGLAQINNYVSDAITNNMTLRAYGGDVLGNIWRFDVNNTIAPAGVEAVRIGTAKDGGGNPQPITIRPELAELNSKPIVFVGTGRLLGASDYGDNSKQSVYGIVDPSTGNSPVYPDALSGVRASLKRLEIPFVARAPGATRTVAPCDAVTGNCNSKNGWVVDLPDAGERVNVGMKLVLGTLALASNVPDASACSSGGYSWINYFNFSTGEAVKSSPGLTVSKFLDNSLTVGFDVIAVKGANGDTNFKGLSTGSGGGNGSLWRPPEDLPVDPPGPTGRRISWREIAQ